METKRRKTTEVLKPKQATFRQTLMASQDRERGQRIVTFTQHLRKIFL